MLVISQKKGDVIKIGRDITVTVLDTKLGRVKIGIEAPASIPVQRQKQAIEMTKNAENEKIFKKTVDKIDKK